MRKQLKLKQIQSCVQSEYSSSQQSSQHPSEVSSSLQKYMYINKQIRSQQYQCKSNTRSLLKNNQNVVKDQKNYQGDYKSFIKMKEQQGNKFGNGNYDKEEKQSFKPKSYSKKINNEFGQQKPLKKLKKIKQTKQHQNQQLPPTKKAKKINFVQSDKNQGKRLLRPLKKKTTSQKKNKKSKQQIQIQKKIEQMAIISSSSLSYPIQQFQNLSMFQTPQVEVSNEQSLLPLQARLPQNPQIQQKSSQFQSRQKCQKSQQTKQPYQIQQPQQTQFSFKKPHKKTKSFYMKQNKTQEVCLQIEALDVIKVSQEIIKKDYVVRMKPEGNFVSQNWEQDRIRQAKCQKPRTIVMEEINTQQYPDDNFIKFSQRPPEIIYGKWQNSNYQLRPRYSFYVIYEFPCSVKPQAKNFQSFQTLPQAFQFISKLGLSMHLSTAPPFTGGQPVQAEEVLSHLQRMKILTIIEQTTYCRPDWIPSEVVYVPERKYRIIDNQEIEYRYEEFLTAQATETDQLYREINQMQLENLEVLLTFFMDDLIDMQEIAQKGYVPQEGRTQEEIKEREQQVFQLVQFFATKGGMDRVDQFKKSVSLWKIWRNPDMAIQERLQVIQKIKESQIYKMIKTIQKEKKQALQIKKNQKKWQKLWQKQKAQFIALEKKKCQQQFDQNSINFEDQQTKLLIKQILQEEKQKQQLQQNEMQRKKQWEIERQKLQQRQARSKKRRQKRQKKLVLESLKQQQQSQRRQLQSMQITQKNKIGSNLKPISALTSLKNQVRQPIDFPDWDQ